MSEMCFQNYHLEGFDNLSLASETGTRGRTKWVLPLTYMAVTMYLVHTSIGAC